MFPLSDIVSISDSSAGQSIAHFATRCNRTVGSKDISTTVRKKFWHPLCIEEVSEILVTMLTNDG
jgi:hypothetical protein